MPRHYANFSAADLRLLLTFLPQFESELGQVPQLFSGSATDNFTTENLPFAWCVLYEMSPIKHFSLAFAALGLAGELQQVAAGDNAIQKMEELSNAVDGLLAKEVERLPEDQKEAFTAHALAIAMSMMHSLRCLLVYGRYLNELIEEAREGAPNLRDKALLNAIRIDPTVVGCPTAISRISRAVVLKDQQFLTKLRSAMSGKLGASESSTYQKLRLVLQVLHESGGVNLNDDELQNLFVKELDIYADSAGASKNLSEFTRKFKKKKSTI